MQRTPWHLAITPLTVWLLLLWAGCAGVRPARPPADLLAQRQEHDTQMAEKASAFGAGVLKGWSRVHGPLATPEFDVVTGVSTGALIAPFAFLGDAPSPDTMVELYRHPRPDLVKQRWPLYFLPAHESFATVPGLERELRARGRGDIISGYGSVRIVNGVKYLRLGGTHGRAEPCHKGFVRRAGRPQ